MDLELLAFGHLQITKLRCFSHVKYRSDRDRWVSSERLIEETRKVVHVSESLVNKGLVKVNFPVNMRVFLKMGFDHTGLDVLKQLLVHLLVLDQMMHQVTNCTL